MKKLFYHRTLENTWVDLSDIPVKKYGNKMHFDWKESVGCKVKFSYLGENGEFIIVAIKNESGELEISYENQIYLIKMDSLKLCGLAYILGYRTLQYKFNIGDIVTDVKHGKIEIISLERTRDIRGKKGGKAYGYECKVCGNRDIIVESALINRKQGCSVCSNRKILEGYNDMETVNKSLFNILKDKNDGKKGEWSNQKVDWICPTCNTVIKNKKISDVNRFGLACPNCSDGISYGEKVVRNVLIQKKIVVQARKMFQWSKNYLHHNSRLSGNKLYDIYFELADKNAGMKKVIIEVNGPQHYCKAFRYKNCRYENEERENDSIKKTLALKNGITDYIYINAYQSDIEFLKKSILSSDLAKILNLDDINWDEVERNSLKGEVYLICKDWENGLTNREELERKYSKSWGCICNYLKRGAKIGWCTYDPVKEKKRSVEESIVKSTLKRAKSLKCIETGDIFRSLTQCEKLSKSRLGTRIDRNHLFEYFEGKRKDVKGFHFELNK